MKRAARASVSKRLVEVVPPPATGEPEVRDKLLEAAFRCAVRFGWARTRMSDVARTAKISRQTLYRHFQTKDGLAAVLALREQDAFLEEFRDAFRTGDTVSDCVRAGVTASLKRAESHPLLRQILEEPESGLLPYVTTRALPLMQRAMAQARELLIEKDPQVDPDTAELLADVLTRALFSYTLTPSEPIDATAERVGRLAELVLAGSQGANS